MNTEDMADAVELINPMNAEQAVMRRAVLSRVFCVALLITKAMALKTFSSMN